MGSKMDRVIGILLILGFSSLTSAKSTIQVHDKLFPGHIYTEAEEDPYDSKEFYPHYENYEAKSASKTTQRPAGDRLFIDGDTGEIDWNQIAKSIIQDFEADDPQIKYEEYSKAKNIILFVGDGMGPSTVSASRIYSMQTDRTRLAFDSFPSLGISRTYATDAQVTDGAAAATAFMCGEKNKRGVLGLNQHVPRGDCNNTAANKLESVLKKSMNAGKWTGVVSTGRVTEPSSASTYANVADGEWETDADRDESVTEYDDKTSCPDIAAQLVDEDVNKNIKVVLGGGRRSFTPNTEADPEYPNVMGRRGDGRNLIDAWVQQKPDPERVRYVWNNADFSNIDADNTDYLMGLFEPSQMQYELDRAEDKAGEPSLPEMVEKAIQILQRSDNGFFLVVSGSRIDDAHHENKAVKAMAETSTLSKAVRVAQELTDEEDTLIVVTADHSNVIAMAGYPFINNDITGITRIIPGLPIPMLDLKPYTTLMYANGPGFLNHRTKFNSSDPVQSITDEDVQARQGLLDNPDVGTKDYFYDAGIYKLRETHGGEDVAVYASGPLSRMFTGTYEQNYIAHAMMYASCLGDYVDRLGCLEANP